MKGRLGAVILGCVLAGCSTAAFDAAPASAARGARAVAPTPLTSSARKPAAPVPPAIDTPNPVRDAALALAELTPDPAPSTITNDKHYLVSNERRLDLYRPEIDDLGGAYLGVGSDQNFILAGWIRPRLLVIVDFDQDVVDLHAVHGALIEAAPSADEFRRLWSETGESEALAIVSAAFEDPTRRRTLEALYRRARPEVDRRFVQLRKRYAELGIEAWLEVPTQYDTVRQLHLEDRVVAIRGDFTEPGVLREIATVLREHALVLRVLYLSNIEQYLAYRGPFKANMLALPFDDESLVLRTLPGRPAGFQYILQRGHDFHAWMRAPKVWSVYRLRGLERGEHLIASERHFIEGRPEQR